MRSAAVRLPIALIALLTAGATPVSPQTREAERVRQIADDARLRAEEARTQAEARRQDREIARQDAQIRARAMMAASPAQAAAPIPVPARVGATDSSYSSGLNALQQRQYERAITEFDRAITRLSPRADGALYWRAFAQYRLRQGELALASLTQLRRDHTASRYLADAKILEEEVRRAGDRPAAAGADDDELKLLAIQGVQRSAQAVTVLEGVLAAVNTLAVKRRALSALGSIEDPRARTVLAGYAKGAGNPDLQIEAIRLIGARRDAPMSEADLRALYTGNTDPAVRVAVLSALAAQENADALVTLARTESAVDLRREIVRRLSDLAPRSKVAADFLAGVLR